MSESGWYDDEPVEYARGGFVNVAVITEPPKIPKIKRKTEFQVIYKYERVNRKTKRGEEESQSEDYSGA